MRPHLLLAFELTPLNTALMALGAGLLAALLVFLFLRYVLNWGQVDPASASRRKARHDVIEDVDPFVHGSKMDRRQALRRGGNPVAVLISDAYGRAEPINGYVLDRSTGGLCLAISEPITEGTILSVKTTNAPTTTPWIKIEVRNCRPINSSEWELGCKFERTPPWSVLLLFG